MNYSKSVQFLLDHACPSIVYRTRKEILGEPRNTPSMLELQKKVQNDPEVKRVLALQKEDGWLGGHFHGADGPEGGIRYLFEKGVEPDHPVIQRALEAIELRGNDFEGLGRIGTILDDYHIGGYQMIRRVCLLMLGMRKKLLSRNKQEKPYLLLIMWQTCKILIRYILYIKTKYLFLRKGLNGQVLIISDYLPSPTVGRIQTI